MTKKILTFFVNFIKETFHLVFAASLLSGLVYLRLLPRISRDLWQNMTNYQVVMTTLNIVFLVINIYIILVLLEILPDNKKFQISTKMIEMVSSLFHYIGWALQNLYMFVWHIIEWVAWNIFKYENLQYQVTRKFAKVVLLFKPKYIFWFLIAIKFLPRIIFVIAFSYDVFYCKHLHYTFKCLPWLLLPLLENFFVFIFENFYECHWEGINSFVLEKQTENPNQATYSFIPEYQDNPPHFVKNFFDFFTNHFEVLISIKQLILEYKIWKYDSFPYFYLYLSLCFIRVLGFSYILFYGLT